MDIHDLTRTLHVRNDSKIVMLVADGLGGLPHTADGQTELEAARTPNLDDLAKVGVQARRYRLCPESVQEVDRGTWACLAMTRSSTSLDVCLEATGIGLALQPGDVAVRCNFCTLDDEGRITDRRAGRIESEKSIPLARRLNEIRIEGVQVIVEPVKEHRFVVLFRGKQLGGNVADTDPQRTGVPPLAPKALDEASQETAELAAEFFKQATQMLADQPQANGLTMRGFAARPALPSYEEVYGLRAAAIAVYPMYKGLASLVGMDVVGAAQTLDEQVDLLEQHWADYDFFFVHFKYTDSTGEDGDFQAKVRKTEDFDAVIPRVRGLNPDVLIVTGDHSTPSFLKSHSWHPVPTLLASNCCRPDGKQAFSERECVSGGLGQFKAKYLMSLALANAGRLGKYGA